ncbi:MAG: FAD-binding protein [Bacteroidales bacterium]|nr:FAD-binding protein [Bacteroidales bacterium]
MTLALKTLQGKFEGEIYTDNLHRIAYATDASAYREKPQAVARPKNAEDLKRLIAFANKNNISLIPRAAGTSLAGQVVGNGLVVDISKYFTEILEINVEEHWVRVQPGVVLDELNQILHPYGLFFAPETSTSNRCMMGGMLGNNSCGAHSLVYGSTRDHTLEVKCILSDGSEAEFKAMSRKEFEEKRKGEALENKLYRQIYDILSSKENQDHIKKEFPDPKIERRNTGYALDILLDSEIFTESKVKFNFSKLLAGSEGTLAFATEIKLNLEPLPPKHNALVCVHLKSIEEALKANLIALKHKPVSIELMDKAIMDLTKKNKQQAENRFFVKGDPGALLIVEFTEDDFAIIEAKAKAMEIDMRKVGYGFHFPLITAGDIKKVWNLRKAGLGVLSNMPGDDLPVPVIEDTAVNPEVLPEYIAEFDEILKKHNKSCVYYAHIATGELHLRPILNLKKKEDVELFHSIALDTAKLVKKYRGSLSGEHGDGRLRGEFIPLMIGEANYALLKSIKNTWDPKHIFNPGKITDTPKMNTHLRYQATEKAEEIKTVFRFDQGPGILRAAEQCTGSGDCRKSHLIGGTMCPSYQATKDERNSTRARANMLREVLTQSKKDNPFDQQELYEVMDLCLSCKACKTECPSNVDVTKLKAEFLQHYYDEHGVPIRSQLIANISKLNAIAMPFHLLANAVYKNKFLSKILLKSIGFSTKREMPLLYKTTLEKWFAKQKANDGSEYPNGKVYLFNDEFTRFNDTEIGIKAILLLNKLGYEVSIPKHRESGRTFLSKGLLRKAKRLANENVKLLTNLISEEHPLLGIEPSTILSFRDEYPELVDESLIQKAKFLATNALMIDEFLAREIDKGNIKKEQFTNDFQEIKLHGHCQQKSVASTKSTLKILGFPEHYSVSEIPSGCCGMAGSFGYEKEHYDLSMKIGEMVLFPAVREAAQNTIIAAPGTSCRCQIKDGTQVDALHPVEILYNALK